MRAGRCGKCGRVLDHVGACEAGEARGAWAFGRNRVLGGDWEYEREDGGDMVRERWLTCWETKGEGCATCVERHLNDAGSTYGSGGTL